MKTFTQRARLVPALVVAALALAAVLLWRPLWSWFAGPPADGEPGAAADTSSGRDHALPAAPLDPATFERLRAAFEATDQVRARLADDSLDGVEPQASATAAALEAAAQAAPTALREHLAAAAAAARALAGAGDLDTARAHFGHVSAALVALADADPRLAEGWQIFECPMTDGFGKWFQRDGALENPYMGQSMLTCGSASSWDAPRAAHDHGGGDIAYHTCPMHPSVRQQEPGVCPICGMDLVPVTEEEVATGTVIVDDARRQRIGVRTAPVQRRPLTLEVRAVGEVTYDQGRLTDVNLRMSGWVENLRVAETGQKVKKGQTLFSLYSPELYAAQLEYLAATRSATGGSTTLASLERAAHNRLRLLGMSDGQIRGLARRGSAREHVPILAPASGYVIEKNVVEGAQVAAGTQVYRIADLERIWVDAEVYERDLPHVTIGQAVTVELPHVPGRSYRGTVDHIYPTLRAETRTGRVRVVLDNPDLELKPDMYANVRFEVELGERLVVPESAVIYTGPRRLVFVDLGEGRLRPREVELGASAGGYYEVVAGLEAGEVVVTSGNFLIAAESRLRSATELWEPGDAAE